MYHEVVITGIGIRSSLSNNVNELIEKMAVGETCVTQEGVEKFSQKTKQFGFLREFEAYTPTNINHKHLSLSSQLALACTKDAFNMANINDFSYNPKWGVALGSGYINIYDIFPSMQSFIQEKEKKASPSFIPKFMGHAPSVNVSLEFQLGGVLEMNAGACAAGMSAIKHSFEAIRRGEQTLMVSGGIDLTASPVIISSWESLRAMSSFQNVADATNPFHKDRDGFVLAEGGCVFILESKQHAKARGANVLAEIKSIHQGSSSFDMLKTHAPTEEKTLKTVLKDSNLTPEDIPITFYHSTGTKLSSSSEYSAIKKVFGQQFSKNYACATKNYLGHTMGASGNFSMLAAIGSFQKGHIYPINSLCEENIDDEFNELLYTNKPLKKDNINHALVNAFAFGGLNISCILSKGTN